MRRRRILYIRIGLGTSAVKLLRGFDTSQVADIGCGGQMHGLVALDKDDNVIRPAIF